MVSKQIYYGTAEVAEACGVSVQCVSNWLARGKMPQPMVKLRMGPVWCITDMRFAVWLERKERRRAA